VALQGIPDRCRKHANDWATRSYRILDDGSASWVKVPGHYGGNCRLTWQPTRSRWSCAVRRMSEDGSRRWSSASFLPTSNRILVQLGTTRKSGQQQSCFKHAKRRWRKVQSNVRCCTSSTSLVHSSRSASNPLRAEASLYFKGRINIFSPPSPSSLRWPGWSLGEMSTVGVASMT
jgi:hypothetical protein